MVNGLLILSMFMQTCVKPCDIASSLHLHHIKTTRHRVRFVAKVLLGYLEFILNIICAGFFYNPHKQFPTAFTLAITALLLPSIIMIFLPRQDCNNKVLTLFRCRLTSEAIISWRNGLETVEFCLIELIESIGGGFPSALIQVYAIMYRTVYDSETEFELLGPSAVIYVSVAVSVFASSWTSARLFTTNEERKSSPAFYSLLFLYYSSEKLYRVMYFSVISLFVSSGGYRHGRNPYMLNAAFLAVSVLARCLLVRYSHQRENPAPVTWEDSWNFLGRLFMSMATSHMWLGEYVLTSRFLLLEFFEAAFYVPFFVWLRHVTDYEEDHFNAEIPILIMMYLYGLKMALLAGRLYFTPHARHVLFNHASILVYESVIVLIAVLIVWSVLITITFAT